MSTLPFAALKLAEAASSPANLLLLAALAGFVLVAATRHRRTGLALLAASLALETAVALLPLDAYALFPLEDRFPPCRTPPPDLAGAIVLGGAVDTAITAGRGQPTLNAAAGRMTELTRLAHLLPPTTTLAFTGGSGRILGGTLTEADVTRRFMAAEGLAARPLVTEDRSRTTWENAQNLARLLHPRPDQRWLLDTSAAHMPRAVAAFRAAGFTVIADPVAYQTAHTWPALTAPGTATRLDHLDTAAHEWTGLLAYRLLGRTRSLLPKKEEQGLCP